MTKAYDNTLYFDTTKILTFIFKKNFNNKREMEDAFFTNTRKMKDYQLFLFKLSL